MPNDVWAFHVELESSCGVGKFTEVIRNHFAGCKISGKVGLALYRSRCSPLC